MKFLIGYEWSYIELLILRWTPQSSRSGNAHLPDFINNHLISNTSSKYLASAYFGYDNSGLLPAGRVTDFVRPAELAEHYM